MRHILFNPANLSRDITKDAPMKRLFANALMLVGFLTASSQILALGLGELTLKSALNQPLVAEIDLVDADGFTEEEMKSSLAGQSVFDKAGVDRSYFLTKIRFQTSGKKILVTTREAVTEPFLNFLVELNWPSGRVLREYTVLLDPPVFDSDTIRPLASVPVADEPPAPVAAPAPAAKPAGMPSILAPAAKPAGMPSILAPASQPAAMPSKPAAPAPARQEVMRQPEPAPVNRATRQNADVSEYYVQPNDTLWAIALATRPDTSVTPQQMMVAIQKQNPDAFIEGNINRLKTHQTLQIPDADQIRAVSFESAVSEVERQNEALGHGNAQLDATGRAASSGVDRRSSTGGEVKLVSAAAVDKKSSAASGEVSKGGSSIRQQALENDLAIALENLDKSRRENQDLSDRLKALDDQIATLQRLVTLKDDQLANMQAGGDKKPVPADKSQPAAVPSGNVTSEVVAQSAGNTAESVSSDSASSAVSAPAVVSEAAAPAPKPVEHPVEKPLPKPIVLPPPPEPDFVGDLLADPVSLGGLLAVLLLLIGGGYMLVSKKRRAAAASDTERTVPDLVAAAGVASAGGAVAAAGLDNLHSEVGSDDFTFKGNDSGSDFSTDVNLSSDFFSGFDEQPESAAGSSMADILAEADMAIAYGNFEEAIEKLHKAIAAQPDHAEFGLKLLEVYAESDDAQAFADEEARLVAGFGDYHADQISSLRSRLSNPVDLANGYDEVSLDDLDMEFQSELDDDLDSLETSVELERDQRADLEADLDDGLDFSQALDIRSEDDFSTAKNQNEPIELDALGDFELDAAAPVELDEVAPGSLDLDSDSLDGTETVTLSGDDLDFDLSAFDDAGSGTSLNSEPEVLADDENALDFDLSGLESLESADLETEKEQTPDNLMEFDLSGFGDVAEETIDSDHNDTVVDDDNLLEFDISSMGLAEVEDVSVNPAAAPVADDNLLDFDVDDFDSGSKQPVSENSEESVIETASDNKSEGMDFDFGEESLELASLEETDSGDFDLADLEAELGDLADVDLDLPALDADDLQTEDLESDTQNAAESLPSKPSVAEVADFGEGDLEDLDLQALDARLDALDSDIEDDVADDDGMFDLQDLELSLDDADELPELSLDDTGELPELSLDNADELPELSLDNADELPELNLDNADELPELSLDDTDELPELSLDDADELPELSLDDTDELPELSLDDTGELPELNLDDADELPELSLDDTDELPELSLDDADELPELSLDDADELPELSLDDADELPELSLDEAGDMPEFELADNNELPDLDLDFDGMTDLPDLEELPELDAPIAAEVAVSTEPSSAQPIDLDALADSEDEFEFLSNTDECSTKLDLARVYVDMGDADGARDLLAEIVQEGTEQQKQEARTLMNSLA
jgi:pilus assembly protein FimV